jgi:hypothetical protein
LKIRCRFHEDTEPSCHVYEDHFHCFVCGAHGPLSAIGLKEPSPGDREPKYVEDLSKKNAYIDSLGEKEIRGFRLRHDSMGYYIRWPDLSYYKHRLYNPEKNSDKYRVPAGHRKTPFWVRRQGQAPLYVVEGEMNAMSIAAAVEQGDVVSPGSTGDIMSKWHSVHLTQYVQYAKVIIVVDRDAAGTAAAIHLKSLLLSRVPYTSILLMETDANEILVKEGKEALRDTITMQARL